MKYTITLLNGLLLAPLAALLGSDTPKPPQPNFIVLLTDDQRYDDLGCTENTGQADGTLRAHLRQDGWSVIPSNEPLRADFPLWDEKQKLGEANDLPLLEGVEFHQRKPPL